jgi:thiol-disulfide isomerase/thioredoxin
MPLMKKHMTLVAVTLIGALMLLGKFSLNLSYAQALPKEFVKPSAKITLLEFSAPWCLSCKKIKPEMDKIQKELGNKLTVYHLNVEEPKTEKYINLYKIDSAPSFILYNSKGKLVQRIDRDITGPELRKLILSAQ